MALVTLDTPETNIPPQAPEATHQGRFFDPRSPKRLIDLENLETRRGEIIELARVISALAHSRVIEDYQQAFNESIKEYEDRIRAGVGLFRLKLPGELLAHSNAYSALLHDYRIDDSSDEQPTVEFTSGALNACSVLPFPQSSGTAYQPMLDARITTSMDTPTQVFDIEAGGVVEQPSSGRWYRFPLHDTEVHLLKPL